MFLILSHWITKECLTIQKFNDNYKTPLCRLSWYDELHILISFDTLIQFDIKKYQRIL